MPSFQNRPTCGKIKEMGPSTLSPSHTSLANTHKDTHIESINNVFLCFQTQSVNVRGPSSLAPGLARCQTTFLQQLPFLTSAALTWFHLTVVKNLFSFSVMKYYTETPDPALLHVLFVIPQLSLCYECLWLLFYCIKLLLLLHCTTAAGAYSLLDFKQYLMLDPTSQRVLFSEKFQLLVVMLSCWHNL